jgi:hypothetical protein
MSGDPRECRLRAAECFQIAESTNSPKYREAFTELARTWLKLATEFEGDNALLEAWGCPAKSKGRSHRASTPHGLIH